MILLLAVVLPALASGSDKPADAVTLPAPKVELHMNEARASSAPWVNANGWRILRNPNASFYYDVPAQNAALAAAESFAYGAKATIHTDADGAAKLEGMLTFLKSLPETNLPPVANIGVVDDGSDATGEFMNLLGRRNLLYRLEKAEDPKLPVNVTHVEAGDPNKQAHEIRAKLTDEKRSVRIYGSEVVIARVTSDGTRARVHLLNYAPRPVRGLRVRVLGSYSKGEPHIFDVPGAKLLDYMSDGTATEFTIDAMNSYAVIDLSR